MYGVVVVITEFDEIFFGVGLEIGDAEGVLFYEFLSGSVYSILPRY